VKHKHFSKLLLSAIVLTGIFSALFSVSSYTQEFKTEAKIVKAENIHPESEVEIEFSHAVFTDVYMQEIKIFPKTSFRLRWEDNSQKMILTPEKFWTLGQTYSLYLPSGRSVMLTKVEEQKIDFSILSYPEIKSKFPQDQAKDVVLDIEDPLKVVFNNPVEDFEIWLDINSGQRMIPEINSEKTEFKFLPREGIKPGEEYSVGLWARYKWEKSFNYKEIDRFSFQTLNLAPSEWSKDLAERLRQAKQYTQSKKIEGKYIDINLDAQIMSIFENGKIIDAFLISSGKKGMDTPKGEHPIYNKVPRAWSGAYALYMPYWMAITSTGKFGIHELPEWPGGYKEGANHLGIPVSHGCVRLGVGSAEKVYNWAEIGTPVVVY